MYYETVDLYNYFGLPRTEKAQGYLTVYVPDDEVYPNRKHPAMLVIPGGAYAFVSPREGEPVALHYLNRDFACFVLKYSCAPVRFPAQLIEGAMAVAYIKENAEKFRVIRDKVCAVGFSAGGHLTAMLATVSGRKEVKDALKNRAELAKPDAVILSYPVITSGEFAHRGSIDNLCGENEKLIKELSLEYRVTADSVPAFIWATADDGGVPSENALMLATAYKRAGVPFELHVFRTGVHGLSIASNITGNSSPAVAKWLELSDTWLSETGFSITD